VILENIADSIRKGETLYSVQHLNEQRMLLLRSTEIIDTLSKKITVLGCDSSDVSDGGTGNPSLLLLQNRIRTANVNFIRDLLTRVPSVQQESPTSGSSGFEAKATKEIFPHDPFQQQIQNVKVFIEQAKKAGKQDEVEMLTKSLKELQGMIK